MYAWMFQVAFCLQDIETKILYVFSVSSTRCTRSSSWLYSEGAQLEFRPARDNTLFKFVIFRSVSAQILRQCL